MDPICWIIAFSGWLVASLLFIRVSIVSKQISSLQEEFDGAKNKSIALISKAHEETRSVANSYREANEAIARARYELENVK